MRVQQNFGQELATTVTIYFHNPTMRRAQGLRVRLQPFQHSIECD